MNNARDAVAWLRSPVAVRSRCAAVFAAAERGDTRHFALDLSRLDATADYVIETMRAAYPDLDIPYHSRWRHFAAGGVDRWALLARDLEKLSPAEIGRIRTELAISSVLLDAGAGADWSYREPGTGQRFERSEGLAVASFHLYTAGVFSTTAGEPLRVESTTLTQFESATLAAAFQVTADNPVVGLDGRVELLRSLGVALAAEPEFFGAQGRLGNLFDYLSGQAQNACLPAAAILDAVLRSLGAIWPGRIELDGINLGDVWRHPAASGDLGGGLVPFHKLSQWLSYSLVEPLEQAGVRVSELEALTGLPEYRNGGLFLDLGVLRPKHAAVLRDAHPVDCELLVEWRALTVVLLDRLAERVRARLGLDAKTLPLAKVLEGGTWSAGRRAARERRADGTPPIRLQSDGTVF